MENPWTTMLVSVAPFVALLVVWAVLLYWLARTRKRGKQTARENLIDPMREVLLVEIVPEIRALRESVDALRKEMADRR